MPEAQQEILWRPDAGLPQDDLARRPSTRFKLCDLCRGVLTTPEIFQPSQQITDGIELCGERLQDTQCSLRAIFLDYLGNLRKHLETSTVNRAEWSDYDLRHGVLTKVSDAWYGETVLNIQPGSSSGPQMSLRVQAYLDDPAAEIISSRPFLPDLGSEDAFEQMRQWMIECEQSHSDCGNSMAATTALPCRVVDVQSLRLHESSLGEVGKYAALTYCWGCETVPGALVGANLQALKEDIPLQTLPQTIQDAIFVTQNLGLKYIWIDAYCIIQDNVEDKQKELACMAEIYSQAYITLSASSAANVHKGFLYKRQPRERGFAETWPYQYPRLVVPFRIPNREGVIGNAVLQEGLSDDWSPRDPIMSRSWTLQERLLSRRILYFGAHELYWQCNGAQRGCGAFEWTGEFSRPRFLSSENHLEDVHSDYEWADLIQEYTYRDITHEEDRLVALAALASKFSDTRGGNDVYLAGLWRSRIRANLLWGPSPWEVENSRPSVYVAPSWSWASVKCSGGILLHPKDASNEKNEQGQPYVEIIECMTTLKTRELPFGQVTGGKIRLRGPLRPELQNQSASFSEDEQEGGTTSSPFMSSSMILQETELGIDRVYWDVESEARDPSLMFHLRVTDKYGLVLISEKGKVFRRVGLSKFATRQNADSFFAPSQVTDIEII